MRKIAVPVTKSNLIDDHFGHCEYYQIYSISEKDEIVDVQTIKSEQGCGCKSNIASILSNNGVTIMLAGNIGEGAINVLNNCGIQIIRGCFGNAEDIVKQYLNGKISDSGQTCSLHEQHNSNCHNS